MKKKKPPVVMASVLIVMVGLAVVLFPKDTPGHDHDEAPQAAKENPEPTGQSRPTPSKEQIAQGLKSTEAKSPKMAAMADMGGPGAGPNGNPATATIFIPKATPMKPTPNDSSVQAQWYRDQARANSPEGFKED